MTIIAFILLAYLLGSIPFAVVTSRIFGLPDPRAYGSRNPGATNVLRSGKGAIALLTLMGDAGKGWLAVVLAQHFVPIFGLGKEVIVAVSLAVFLGHIFSVFLCFKGGRWCSNSSWCIVRIKSLGGITGDSNLDSGNDNLAHIFFVSIGCSNYGTGLCLDVFRF